MDNKSSIQDLVAQRLDSDPVLAEFLKPLPNMMTRSRRNVGAGFKRMANQLSSTRRSAIVQIRLDDENTTRCWCLALTPKHCEVLEGETENPNLEIRTQEETWAQIAGGQLSPLEAFGQGKMRVRGDIELARSIVRTLQRR